MARLQILSDLHLEAPKSYDIFNIPANAESLALIGDIGYVRDEGYFQFISVQLSKFRTVLLLLGNHEPYHSSWENAREKLFAFQEECRLREQTDPAVGTLVFLDRNRHDLSADVTVLGCTLHSKILPEQEESISFGLNDFYHINEWTTEKHTASHVSDLEWLQSQVTWLEQNEPHRRIVILTHHSPTVAPQSLDPAHTTSKISSGFATDLSGHHCWASRHVVAWAFGHTHFNCDYVDITTGKRVVTNQRGYYFSQSENFDVGKVIEV